MQSPADIGPAGEKPMATRRSKMTNTTPDGAIRQGAATQPSRRRFLGILGCAAGSGILINTPASSALAGAASLLGQRVYRWRGVVLGAVAHITIVDQARAVAQAIVGDCLVEIARLEGIFSLYKNGSALSRLNRTGALADPPADLLRLLSLARRVSVVSAGAFDASVQPLWRLYADHFVKPGADPTGPSAKAVADILEIVNYRNITLAGDRVSLAKPGMALTLNGIGQGYIADRVVALMRARGLDRSLVDLGEVYALGRHSRKRPWRAGIADPRAREGVVAEVDLVDSALATSGDYGTRFDPAGRFQHILDARTGRPARYHRSVSVKAPSAAIADALSTACFAMQEDRCQAAVAAFPEASAIIVRRDGSLSNWL